MGAPPTPSQIYERARAEGERRLGMPVLEQVSTGFVAGVTVVFGIVAMGVTAALAEPRLGSDLADLVGGLAFGLGLVFVVIGRAELFSENFFDPVAAAFDDRNARAGLRLVRLWGVMLLLNLAGGSVLVALLSVDGALPGGSGPVLVHMADEIASKDATATLTRAVAAGALLTQLSYMLNAVETTTARIAVAHMVGFILAVGPFDHVVVSALHLLFGVWLGGPVGYGDIGTNVGLSVAGNLLGGLLLITLTHAAQVKAAPHGRPRR